MSELFLSIVNMSISASWIVLAVLILRLILKKAPKWITVLLWAIVAVRLVCPLSFESVFSLIPSAQTINPEFSLNTPAIDSGVAIIDNAINPILSEATITVQPEKEIVMILVSSDIKNDILHGLYRAVGLNTPSQGIAFSMPVDAAVGLFGESKE